MLYVPDLTFDLYRLETLVILSLTSIHFVAF